MNHTLHSRMRWNTIVTKICYRHFPVLNFLHNVRMLDTTWDAVCEGCWNEQYEFPTEGGE